MESAKPEEREEGISYIQGYIRCSDKAKYAPLLVKALKDTNPKVRVSAAQTLEKLHATETVADVIPLLEDPVDDVKERAAFTLGGFGPAAQSAVPAIKKAQAAAKAARKNGLEATMEGVVDEIAGKKDNKRTKCS
jgi:HEAT repeat protein